MPKGGLPEKVLSKTRHREYWLRPPSKWDVESWYSFFEKKFETTRSLSQNALKEELNILVLNLNHSSRAFAKAETMLKEFKNYKKGRVTASPQPSPLDSYPLQSVDIFNDDYETYVEASDLRNPCVSRDSNGERLDDNAWNDIRTLIETYREKIPDNHCIFNPLFYYIIDHSGQHGPTAELLKDYLPSIRKSLPNVNFKLPKLSSDLDKFFDELFSAKDLQDVRACTDEQRVVKKLVDMIRDSIDCPNKEDISEYEHTMRNIVPFIDASVRKDSNYRVRYFENTLQATAIRRNMGRDPNEHARMGYKVDVLIKLPGLHWSPDIGCGEVSGGLPRCHRAKEWTDTLKLGLELRDVLALAKEQLNGVDTSNLVVWGFTVIGHLIRIYAIVVAGGLIHLILAYEAPIPSASWNMCNTKIAYCTMLGYLEKLNSTKTMLANLNNERATLLCCETRREMTVPSSSPPIVATPQKRK